MSRTRLSSLVTATFAGCLMGPSPVSVVADDDDHHHSRGSFVREDAGYVNVHTTAFPAGEIRGQVK